MTRCRDDDRLVLALLGVVLITATSGCPGRPAPRRTAASRPLPPPPAIQVLHEHTEPEGFVQLLGVDWQRREAYTLIRSFSSVRPRPPVRLVTVPLAEGGPARSWTLPTLASAMIREGLLYDLPKAQGAPWLLRLVGLLGRLGPWYVWRHPPVLSISPKGDRFVFSETADKRALAGVHSGRPEPLNGQSPACYRTAFSPDGRYLAYSCFSQSHATYCPTLRLVDDPGGRSPLAPRLSCSIRGSAVSGPFWQPDSKAFVLLQRRGFGAYRDSVRNVCLVRVEVPSGRSLALWCKPLDSPQDGRRHFVFRPAPDGRTGVLLESDGLPRSRRAIARWLRLSDGKLLSAWQGLPTGLLLPPFVVLGPKGRLLVRAEDDNSLLVADLSSGQVKMFLRGRHVDALQGPEGSRLVVLEKTRGEPYRLLAVDLARAPSEALPPLGPLQDPRAPILTPAPEGGSPARPRLDPFARGAER